ncbi:MAG: septum formation initiator family protein [Clostridia bacterium]|nr:septum formation initiator family protein [Clostridia bacterium]
MKTKLITKRDKLIMAGVIVILLAFLAFYTIPKLITIRQQNEQIAEIQSSIDALSEENSKMSQTLEHVDDDKYKEDVARENGYVHPEERVYIDNDAD